MAGKYYWIKERHNPQLRVYYVPQGRITVKEARAMERPLYGDNYMLKFNSLEEYEQKIRELKAAGEKVR